jgi:hypothetical protein
MELYDIYPLEEIVEYSLYQLLFSVGLFISLCYMVIKYYKKRKQKPLTPLEILEKSDYSMAKEIAFKLSYYGNTFVKSPEQEEAFILLKEKLAPFKYSHKEDVLNQNIQDEIQTFINNIRQKNV